MISRVLSRRKVLSLADADGPGAAFACCSLRLDGEPALPPLVDAECAAPEDAQATTAGGGRRWTARASATPETMDGDGDRRESGARNWGGNGGAGEAEQKRINPK
jgi:hypothetical protein